MRKWHKFYINANGNESVYLGIDKEAEDHEKTMGGYASDDCYKDKKSFFNKFYYKYHFGRLENYDKFLRKHLKKEEDILSVASGRSVNELFLSEDGYRITSSDLRRFGAYDDTKRLFPDFKFEELNILEKGSDQKYDCVISLSLIYLFNDAQLGTFFKNINRSMKTGGRLILDSAGSPDNMLSNIINDVILKYEMKLIGIALRVFKGAHGGIVTKHHGYRRRDNEILTAARTAGFKLIDQHNYAFSVDFRRSYLISKMINARNEAVFEKAFNFFGKSIPYTRLFCLEKIDEV